MFGVRASNPCRGALRLWGRKDLELSLRFRFLYNSAVLNKLKSPVQRGSERAEKSSVILTVSSRSWAKAKRCAQSSSHARRVVDRYRKLCDNDHREYNKTLSHEYAA